MPYSAVASCDTVSTGSAVVNRQMQRNGTVATGSISVDMSRSIRAIRVIRVPPSKAVAHNSRGVASSAVVNRQMQCSYAVNTRRVRYWNIIAVK